MCKYTQRMSPIYYIISYDFVLDRVETFNLKIE